VEGLSPSSLFLFGLLVAFGGVVGWQTNFSGALVLNVLFLANLGVMAFILFGMTQTSPELVFLATLSISAAFCVPMTLMYFVRQWIPKAQQL